MKLLIISGLSGAGKSQALKVAEDIGYYCVDNLPPSLAPKFVEIVREANMPLVALVLDIRSKLFFQEIETTLTVLKKLVNDVEIIFLEADEKTLIKRYKELRRPHPLNIKLLEGIQEEIKLMSPLRMGANHIIDTTKLNNHSLKVRLQSILIEEEGKFSISLVSFGFKHGILEDGDMVFDVRFIPNPYYIDDLKEINGTKEATRDYVLKWEQSQEFVNRVSDLIDYLEPFYMGEGRDNLTVGIGCTGGFHRSVAIAEAIHNRLIEKGHSVIVGHRDIKGK